MKTKVWNDNSHPYMETFKGVQIVIPANSSIEMDLDDANMFLGSMGAGIKLDGTGVQDPRSYKNLRIEKLGVVPAMTHDSMVHRCNACNFVGVDQLSLSKHVVEKHSDQLVSEPVDEMETLVKPTDKKTWYEKRK